MLFIAHRTACAPGAAFPPRSGVWTIAGSAIARSWHGARSWYKRRSARLAAERHLAQLPDAMLKDIGIHRSEIASVVRCGGRDQSRMRRHERR